MNFIAVDVETANPAASSICQIGIATYRNGNLHSNWSSLINPNSHFDSFNVSLHGINENAVRNSPTWSSLRPTVLDLMKDQIVVTHSPFDRTAILRASMGFEREFDSCRWLDSAMVARRAWPKFSKSGYALKSLAAEFSIVYKHHDALDDALCAGSIVLRAVAETKLTPEEWLTRVGRPINLASAGTVKRELNPEGALYGEVLVFTGTSSISKSAGADLMATLGCAVEGGVTKHTTILVVGEQDISKLAGHEKSSKHRDAEDRIRKGKSIRIMTKPDFDHLVSIEYKTEKRAL